MRIRARYDGSGLVPLDPIDLLFGDEVELEIVSLHRLDPELRPGSPQAILKALREGPKLSAEACEEFERALKEADDERCPCRKYRDQGGQAL